MLLSAVQKTPVGNIYLIADSGILIAAGFKSLNSLQNRLSPSDKLRKIEPIEKIPKISKLIDNYFEGRLDALNLIQVRQPGAQFSQKVWKVMRAIPVGMTISYAQLAKKAGSPAAFRAAGTACGNNLIAPIIPCHRIIKSDGTLGNYGYGVAIKEKLLRLEGAIKQIW
jgi:methylated-DNA-[protein]-cysteine S-methyltransferase